MIFEWKLCNVNGNIFLDFFENFANKLLDKHLSQHQAKAIYIKLQEIQVLCH